MLLRSRGGVRGRSSKSGLLSRLGSGLVQLVGGSSHRSMRRQSGSRSTVPGWIALAVALLCFGGGYVVRGYVDPGAAEPHLAGLKAGPRAPGVIEAETEPLRNQGFFVAAYVDVPATEAKRRAVELSRYLQEQGLEKARPYEYPAEKGRIWVVVVYFDGPVDRADTSARLKALPADVPDEIFVGLRNTEMGWPNVYPIR